MSPVQQKPILHGRDHCPGGADPIPCMISGPSGDFETVVLATSDLLAYWRLGETGEPWADTSGVSPLTDLDETGSGTAPTPDVTGALPDAQDDGAVELNYDGTASGGGRYLQGASAKDFDLAGSAGQLTVVVWAKVKASALSRRGLLIGTSTTAAMEDSARGWGLQVVYPGRTVRFTRGDAAGSELYAETPSGVVEGEWNFFAGTFDGEQIRLYANAVLVDSTADTRADFTTDNVIKLGYAATDYVASSLVHSWFYGTLDEAAIWTRALSQAEIELLYSAGVEGAEAGSQVLLSDGEGGSVWGQVPPRAMEPGEEGEVLQTQGGAVVWDSAPGGDPAEDTLVWMPLADSDGTLVLDGGDAVIPTLVPI